MKRIRLLYLLVFIITLSCQNNKRNIYSVIQEWENREILFPEKSIFTKLMKDTILMDMNSKYKILTYIDSTGCVSCKLHLTGWKDLINTTKSISKDVEFIIFLCPKDMNGIFYKLLRENFDFPICIDQNDQIGKLNHFSRSSYLHTFLLDSTNHVIAIGDPVQNPEIKRLYLNIITGKAPNQKEDIPFTTILLDKPSIDFGVFPWKEEQKAKFIIKNTGNESLVIKDIITSCDCTTVSYKKEPVPQNGSLEVEITFKAEHPEVFERDITVYCNANNAPIEVTVKGEAK